MILVVEIRFSTQQEVIWDFLPCLCPGLPSWLRGTAVTRGLGITAVMCPAGSFHSKNLTQEPAEILQNARRVQQLPRPCKHISQFNRHCWLFTIGLWEHGLCVSRVLSVFTADKSVSAALIPSRWVLTNDTQKNPPFNCDLIPLPAKIKTRDHRLFFRNIFYLWCQRWNVQSVGPKERFFSSIETNNKQKITFFKSIYM